MSDTEKPKLKVSIEVPDDIISHLKSEYELKNKQISSVFKEFINHLLETNDGLFEEWAEDGDGTDIISEFTDKEEE